MPQFFGLSQLQNAITTRALPTLEQLATNPNRLDNSLNHRFERDDPPPYESSSESESEEALHHPALARAQEVVLEQFRDLLSKPLNDNEIRSLVSTLDGIGIYTPGGRYIVEVKQEHDLLDRFYSSANINAHAHDLLKFPRGYQRRDVIIRRNIRKRWQRLGIWNPEWGIPGRVNGQSKDYVANWKWKWQSTADPPSSDPRHPISRAVQLRRNLGYGEYAPPPPRSHLRDDSSASEAESFIISRPWLIWEVEKFEFMGREDRIPVEQRGRPIPTGEDDQVVKWWKERGHWPPGWKWPHESPSPEPEEDLTPLNTDELDFTPSEVDALEAIGPNSSPKLPPQRDSPPKWNLFGGGFKPVDAPEDASLGAAAEPEDQLLQEVEEQPPSSPPRRRGRPRKRSQQAELAAAPRRSTRIAPRNTKPSPVTAPKETRTRRPRGPPAARNVHSVADAPKKRGRPRKTQDGGITKPAASSGKKGTSAAVAAAAAAVDGNATETTAAAAGKRPRGRPRRGGKPG